MNRDRSLRRAFLLLAVSLLASLPVLAQKITGDISGTVQDTTGAVVKDAKVTATNYATAETRSASTSDSGFFRIIELPPGNYKVTAVAPGFKTSTRDVQVSLSLVTQSDFQLQPGQVSETIEVEGAAPLVETTEDRLSTLFEGKTVADLPNNGRRFQQSARRRARRTAPTRRRISDSQHQRTARHLEQFRGGRHSQQRPLLRRILAGARGDRRRRRGLDSAGRDFRIQRAVQSRGGVWRPWRIRDQHRIEERHQRHSRQRLLGPPHRRIRRQELVCRQGHPVSSEPVWGLRRVPD